MLSLLTLNAQAAGLARAAKLYDWLAARDDHAVVLTETSNGPGTAHILDRCRDAGLTVMHARSADGDRGTAIISRIGAVARPDLTADISLPGRAVAVSLNTEPVITLLGIYVPSSDRAPAKVAKKRTFLTSTIEAIGRMPPAARRGLIVAGDYNVIRRDHRPHYPAFQQFEYEFLDRLEELGLTDAHHRLLPREQVYSWYGRGENGYRFDYFHTGQELTDLARSCSYIQEPRTRGLSDHAAVVLGVAARPRHQPTSEQTDADAQLVTVSARIKES